MKVLIISFSNLLTDPRVIRQIECLRRHCEITAAGFNGCAIPDVEFIPVDVRPRTVWGKIRAVALLKTRRYEAYYWSLSYVRSAWQRLHERRFDAIVANDINALPLALRLAPNGKVLFDAHEYSPREFEENLLWRLLFKRYHEHLCSAYLAHATSMITVSKGIAEEYKRVFGVSADVIANATYYRDLKPAPLEPGLIRLVHHGAASPLRKLESVIRLMDILDDRFVLDLFLLPVANGYVDSLRRLARRNPRIRFRDPVVLSEIPSRTNCYDVGVSFLPATSFNNYYALPNKFFEFIQARLAIATGPFPEMAALVRRYECGIVADSFSVESLAEKLNSLTAERIAYYKRQSDLAARELCFEKYAPQLLHKLHEVAEAR